MLALANVMSLYFESIQTQIKRTQGASHCMAMGLKAKKPDNNMLSGCMVLELFTTSLL